MYRHHDAAQSQQHVALITSPDDLLSVRTVFNLHGSKINTDMPADGTVQNLHINQFVS